MSDAAPIDRSRRTLVFVEVGALPMLPTALRLAGAGQPTIVPGSCSPEAGLREALRVVETCSGVRDAIIVVAPCSFGVAPGGQHEARSRLAQSLLRRSSGGRTGSLTFVLADGCESEQKSQVLGLVDALTNELGCVGVSARFTPRAAKLDSLRESPTSLLAQAS
ncbi:MAG TPA: hypothetical protein VNG33_08315 [Polyangiaceae bacterium]|nr:hypothetical protein [Polyangiaceae bacterium]